MFYLSIGGAIFFHDPTSLCAQSLQDLVVVAVLGKLVVPLSSKAGVDLGSNRSPSSLSPLVILPLLPRRHPPRRSTSGHRSGQQKPAPLPSAGHSKYRICVYDCAYVTGTEARPGSFKFLGATADEEGEMERLLPF